MTKIYHAFTKYHSTIYMFGDTYQSDPVEKGSQCHYDYFSSVAISVMCLRRVQMKYKEGCSRYDTKTRDMLTKFLETGKVTAKFADRKPLFKNICYLNSTRQKVTKECGDRFTVDKQSHDVEFIYDGEKKLYPVCPGMPMLATTNRNHETKFII